MSDQSTRRRLSILRHITMLLALIYLLLMVLYFLSRFIVQDRVWFMSLLNTFALLLFIPLPVLLVLAFITRSRRAALFLLPILIWALLWFGTRFLPKNLALSASTLPTFRVMTNNVGHFNQSSDSLLKLIQEQKPDIIFLQEVDLANQEQALTTLDSLYPYQVRHEDEMRSGMYIAYNITYSRFPFVTADKIGPYISELPSIYRHVIEIDGQYITLYNIHLLSPGGRPVSRRITRNYFVRQALSFDDTIRNIFVNALLSYLTTEPYPYVVAGDFNTSDFSMTYSHIAAQMKDSFAEAGIGLGSSWPVARALGLPSVIPPLIRIDYIWHSTGLRAINAREGSYVGSDHLPVFADLAISPP